MKPWLAGPDAPIRERKTAFDKREGLAVIPPRPSTKHATGKRFQRSHLFEAFLGHGGIQTQQSLMDTMEQSAGPQEQHQFGETSQYRRRPVITLAPPEEQHAEAKKEMPKLWHRI